MPPMDKCAKEMERSRVKVFIFNKIIFAINNVLMCAVMDGQLTGDEL